MPRAKKGKAAKTVVKTGVTTGTAVALLFLSASAAFAAAAFSRPAMSLKPSRVMKLPNVQQADLVFKDAGAAILSNNDPTLRVSGLYYNNGLGNAGEHTIAYSFTNASRTQIGSVANLAAQAYPALESNGSRQLDERIANVPADAAFITLYLDYGNRVNESTENNNQISVPVNRPGTVTRSLPDLTLSDPEWLSFPGAPGLYGAVVVKNIGTLSVPTSMVSTEWYSGETRIHRGPADLIASVSSLEVPAGGQTRIATISALITTLRQFNITKVKLTVDPFDQVRELREDNNTVTLQIPTLPAEAQ